MAIAVVTDSTSDLPGELALQYGISVVPLHVNFGDKTYRDGVDIEPDEFYARLQSGKTFPTTSAPSSGAFIELYQELARSHDGIISLHLSSKVSATYASAAQAAEEVREQGITVEAVDTLQASMALGLVAIGVAKAAAGGASLDEAVDKAKSLSSRATFTGLVETLEYLQKGGRIGKAQALLGSLLRIKPILALVDGEAHGIERARTRSRGIARIKSLVAEAAPLEALCVLHTTDPELAKEIAEDLSQYAPDGKALAARLGPVVGTYLGPGMLGFGMIRAE
ncbi:MAG: DegV family protein [Chloroflexi bacterium]|nr:DegV family protein [Chloroflexota bacterium]